MRHPNLFLLFSIVSHYRATVSALCQRRTAERDKAEWKSPKLAKAHNALGGCCSFLGCESEDASERLGEAGGVLLRNRCQRLA